jgi:hypothetical protein
MPLTLAGHLSLIADELEAARRAPLSRRKALLVATLLDNFADRAFAARRGDPEAVFGAEDLPAYREALRRRAPSLGLVFDLGAQRPDGPRLEVVDVEVPIAEYHLLSVEDYMVSLYNRNTVQRVVIAGPGDARVLAHPALAEALAFWQAAGLPHD